MPREGGLSEAECANFRKEARVMRSLPPHRHVLQLLGMCTKDPAHFHIITELCALGPLQNRLEQDAKEGKLERGQQLAWAISCAQGVLHLHQHNIVHRDLAARNLLLTADEVLKVSDFGLSRDTVEDGNTTKAGIIFLYVELFTSNVPRICSIFCLFASRLVVFSIFMLLCFLPVYFIAI